MQKYGGYIPYSGELKYGANSVAAPMVAEGTKEE